ncbi:MAG: hypothetical protein ACI8Z5_002163 [Lentimonas sp.]|jgi:hypothetical protein
MSPQLVALFKMLAMFAGLIAGAVFFLNWAKQDTKSELAYEVREVIGIEHPLGSELAPVVVVPEPMVKPKPVVEVIAPRPLAIELSYADFVSKPDLWPRSLELTLETSVPILYRERDFGTMRFVPGLMLELDKVLASKEVVGSVNGNYLIVPAEKTSLMPWFHDTYRGKYFMRYPGVLASAEGAAVDDGRFHVDLLEGLRKWCYINFGDCTFDITDDALVLRWRPKEDAPIDYRAEARAIAREYLKRQAELGATDNYAPCEIYDRSSGALLGIGSFFVPSFVAQDFLQ